jgi:putative restriction endonuclease
MAVSLGFASPPTEKVGKPVMYLPRLGQGGFRSKIIDAYDRRCAVTGERTLPALEAAHIVPYAQAKLHDVQNGLLLRADLHKLFDDGYLTINPEYRVEVSKRIKTEYENGRDYYSLHGRKIALPADPGLSPRQEYLAHHASRIYRD